MYKHLLLVFTFSCLYYLASPGQCKDHIELRKRILLLKDSKMLSPQKELVELRGYEGGMRRCAFKNDSVHVLLLQRIGKLLADQGDIIKAIEYNRRSTGMLAETIASFPANSSRLIVNYFTLANLYGNLKKDPEKFRYFDSCIAVAQRMKIVDIYSLYPLLQKVEHLFNTGDYDLCVQFASMGENLSRKYVPEEATKQYGDSIAYAHYFLVPKVNALLNLERYDEAERLLLKKIGEWKKAEVNRFIGTLYEQLARVQMSKKNYKAAFDNIKQAFIYNLKAGEIASCKVDMDNLGFNIYQVTKNHKLALYYYRKALQFHENTTGDSVNSVNLYSHIAAVYVDRHLYDSAQYFFQCAFDQIKKGTDENEVVSNPLNAFIQQQQVTYVTNLFIDKGNAYFKEYKSTGSIKALDNAMRVFRLTDLLFERIKTSQSEMQSKLFWRKDTHHFYELAIEASIVSGKVDDAFYYFERSRAILLYDQLNEQSWLGQNEINRQNQLALKLDEIKKQMARCNPTSIQYNELEGRWFILKQDHQKLQESIKEKNPLYYQNYIDSTFTTLRDVRQNILRDHQALVELFLGDSLVYSMVITPSNTYFATIRRQAYDSTLNLCIDYISDPVLLNREFHKFASASKHLYELIFQQNPVPSGRIIVSPDGRYFPFESLVTSFSGGEPVYFLNDHAVSYTYSARYLMNRFASSSKRGTKNFLGIAPVQFPDGLHLSPLAGSNSSVEKLERFFSQSDNMLGEKATKQEFKDRFGHYQVIQIYTHSSDSSSEGEPVIYFVDKPLYLSEITSQKQPSTKLVVLSACETGKGKFFQGEGVFSFNRAFAAIGIPSCINNLWSVDNESTYQLTEIFFRYLSEGLTIDRALQQAKLEFIRTSSERDRLPYYWAAAILAGKTNPIVFRDPVSWTGIMLVIAAVIGLGLLTWLAASKTIKYKSGRNKDFPPEVSMNT